MTDNKSLEGSIRVYENNAGDIFLHLYGGDHVFQDNPFLTDATIQEDAEAITTGDTIGWSEKWVLSYELEGRQIIEHPATRWIATWYPDKTVEQHSIPGHAGKFFLGIAAEGEE